jgi:hypothetical protein
VRAREQHTHRQLSEVAGDRSRTRAERREARANLEQVLSVQHGAKQDLYWFASLLRSMERVREIGWVIAAGSTWAERTVKRGDEAAITDWLTGTIPFLERLFTVRAEVATTLLDGDRYPPDAGRLSAAQQALQAHLQECDQVLQLLVDRRSDCSPDELLGGLEWHYALAHGDAGRVDLRERIVARLGAALDPLIRSATRTAVAGMGDAALLHEVMRERGRSILQRLAVLDVLCLQEHAIGAPGGDDIEFRRMSAAAPTIGAREFEVLYEWSTAQYPGLTHENALAPNVKLAGNELGSFSAFLDARWRTNDWYWGRMDAVPTLLAILQGVSDDDLLERDPLVAQVRERQGQIWTEAEARLAAVERTVRPGSPPPTAKTWAVGLETLQAPGSTSLVRAAKQVAQAAASVGGAAMGPSAPPVSGLLRSLATFGAGRWARPKGWPHGTAKDGPPSPDGVGESKPLGGLAAALLALFAVALAATVAGAVYAINDRVWSFVPGIGVGVMASLLVVGFGVVVAWGSPSATRTRVLWLLAGAAIASLVWGVGLGWGPTWWHGVSRAWEAATPF